MTFPRRLFSLACAFIATLVILFGISEWRGSTADRAIAKNRQVEAAFGYAVAYVEGYRKIHNRLPGSAEFEAWAAAWPPRPYTPHGVWIESPPLQEVALNFDPAAYPLLGSGLADGLTGIAAGAMLLLTAWRAWPRRSAPPSTA